MYKIKPIVEVWPHLDLPNTMYPMKAVSNLELTDDKSSPSVSYDFCVCHDFVIFLCQLQQITIEMNEIDVLAARQEKILLQLEQFKKQLASIKADIGKEPTSQRATGKTKATATTVTSLQPVNTQLLQDLVVNANPNRVPYCILGLKKLWAHRLTLNIQFFQHSTVAQLSDDVMNFVNKVKSLQTAANLPVLNLTVIWKDGEYSKALLLRDS